jgi:phytoene dehydrogenase-like protein
MYDIIIIGAGPGGLTAGVNLTKHGYKVLMLERNFFFGGTSSTFKRRGFTFPMGPLGFSSPAEIKALLTKIGITEKFQLIRNHFQIITPFLNLIYSQSLQELNTSLQSVFPQEKRGIETVLSLMKRLIAAIEHVTNWHPAYRIGTTPKELSNEIPALHQDAYHLIEQFSKTPANTILQEHITNDTLRRFLGTMGTGEPRMSFLLLTIMWYLMAEKGIWYPSGGLQGVSRLMRDQFLQNGGTLKLSTPVKEILVDDTHATGVRIKDGTVFNAKWIISNSDYKSTFLKLIQPKYLPPKFLQTIQEIPYFGSEFCVYLGVDAQALDLTKLEAHHVFYRKVMNPPTDLEDFDNREIEICFWSRNDPSLAPNGKEAIVLRVPFPYNHFAHWKVGERKRTEGYVEYKTGLANQLIKTVESLLSGLSDAIEVMQVATPLTYEEFGQRFHGSIAGWSWDIADTLNTQSKLLIRTPIPNLLMAGLYASAELFLGGVPTSMYTGYWASELVRKELV